MQAGQGPVLQGTIRWGPFRCDTNSASSADLGSSGGKQSQVYDSMIEDGDRLSSNGADHGHSVIPYRTAQHSVFVRQEEM